MYHPLDLKIREVKYRLTDSVNLKTYLPYADFTLCACHLKDEDLCTQRLHSFQIIRALCEWRADWIHHPAIQMWRGHEWLLIQYQNAMTTEWNIRGYKSRIGYSLEVHQKSHDYLAMLYPGGPVPVWLYDPEVHAEHRYALWQSDPVAYRLFEPKYSTVGGM